MLVINTASLVAVLFIAAVAPWAGAWNSGTVTFYGGEVEGMNPSSPSYGTLDGSCGQGAISKSAWPHWSVAAVAVANPYYSGPSYACGQCFQICCNGQNAPGVCKTQKCVTVQITDSCPECMSKNGAEFDLQALTFASICNNPNAVGRLHVDWQPVRCTPPGNIIFNVPNNNGANSWVKISVQQVAGAGQLAALQISGPGTGWQAMRHTYGGVYETSSAPGAGPWSFIVTTADGQRTVCNNVLGAYQTGLIQSNCQIGGGTVSSDSASNAARAIAPKTKKKAAAKKKTACKDVPPGGGYTCAQQKGWGKCKMSWMTHKSSKLPKGYCAHTCGRC